MDLESVADELYGASLDEFVTRRNAREKEAKSAGDRDLAASIHQLTKPSATAWLANQLVRQHRGDLEPLLELGASLRAAMASLSGPELRTLGQQQHRLIAALVAQAGALAVADGRKVSADTARGLEQTLHAALADSATAQTLMQGQLTEALQDSGFAPSTGSAQPVRAAGPVTTGRKRASEADRRAAADAERQEAQAALDAATADRDRALAAADGAETALDDTVARIARLREELDRAGAEQTRLDHEHHRLRAEATQAERAVTIAGRRVDAAANAG